MTGKADHSIATEWVDNDPRNSVVQSGNADFPGSEIPAPACFRLIVSKARSLENLRTFVQT